MALYQLGPAKLTGSLFCKIRKNDLKCKEAAVHGEKTSGEAKNGKKEVEKRHKKKV